MQTTAPRADTAARRDRLRTEIASTGAEAAVITRAVNIAYLSGFVGSAGVLVVTAKGVDVLATDGRYTEAASVEAPGIEVHGTRRYLADSVERAIAEGATRLAYESHDLTVDGLGAMRDAAGTRAGLVSIEQAVERLRLVKDEVELGLLRAACATSDRAFARLLEWLRPGLTERQVAHHLEELLIDCGGEALAFETIVATGANGSQPHHHPGDTVITAGDLLTCDFGAKVGGYHADITRTVAIGRSPSLWAETTYALVAAAQRQGVDAARAGATLAEVDAAAREVVVAAGRGEEFPHGLGHGVGLEIHEAPLLSATSEGILAAGVPVTVEPGVYLPGHGGVRIEDTIVVTDGTPELLTTTTRELLVVG